MAEVYEMRRYNGLYYFELHVSKTREEMKAYIDSLYYDWCLPIEDSGADEDTKGMVHPMQKYLSNGEDSGIVGICFLNEEDLDIEVISHESVHLGLCFERYANKIKFPRYGKGIDGREERLAYLVGGCASGIYNTLKENGHIKE